MRFPVTVFAAWLAAPYLGSAATVYQVVPLNHLTPFGGTPDSFVSSNIATFGAARDQFIVRESQFTSEGTTPYLPLSDPFNGALKRPTSMSGVSP